jgi:tRNA modification GTPase
MTGAGSGAIATIQIFGTKAKPVLEKIFRPQGDKKTSFKSGDIILGTINDVERIIDQVTIGCEGKDLFAVNCHGNPLITADITRLLQSHKVIVITSQQLLQKIYCAQVLRTIQIEARIAQASAKTIAGTKIILYQTDKGLNKKAQGWLKTLRQANYKFIKRIQKQAGKILEDSKTAKILIDGAKIAITGPPNSGKSTLLNYLAGNVKSIVTDIAGTTLDYVTCQCRMGSLFAELTDTAGLERRGAEDGGQRAKNREQRAVERIAQKRSMEIIGDADLVLLVLDRSRQTGQLDEKLIKKTAHKRTVTILNKADLPSKLNIFKLPKELRNCVTTSAKTGEGIENLVSRIQQKLGVSDFNLRTAVCVTSRQEKLLKNLIEAQSRQQAVRIITELLNGRL